MQAIEINPAQAEQIWAQMQAQKSALHMAEQAFRQRYPTYHTTAALDSLRQTQYSRLDADQQIYLDYTGGGIYAAAQLESHMQLLMKGVYGNPHSSNPTSFASTELTERARSYVHEYFNADPTEYVVIFTSNASGALRLVGEAYPFEQRGQYLLTFDNHNSVNGIREFARSNGAPVTYSPMTVPDLRIDAAALTAKLDQAIPNGNNLFAYPAQSNFSGVKHSLEWIQVAHDKGWDVLVDCAAFAPTNHLDLARCQPDFVSLSFYKMFGYPTGVGALIARRSILPKLRRPWFAGGTITVASVQADKHFLEDGNAAFEDGTIDYLNLPAVEIGLRHMAAVGVDTIRERVQALTGYLLDELSALHHENGQPLVTIYGPTTTDCRGGTISFNLYDPNGTIFDYRLVEGLANHVRISLRTGCFCNPGAGELAMNIDQEEISALLTSAQAMSFEQLMVAMTAEGQHDAVGAVRISVGLATNFNDVHHFVCFAKTFLNQRSAGLRAS